MLKRGFSRVNSLLAFVLTALAIVSPRSFGQGPVTIEIGTLSAEDGDGWILSQIKGFERNHPDIRVRYFAIGVPSRDEVRIEDLPERALNIIGVRSDMGYEIGYLVERGLIVPLERFLPDPEFRFEDFFPNVWDAVTYRGKRWGVPFLCSSVVMVADWSLFEEAGIRTPPHTWEEVMQVLPQLTRDSDGDGETDEWGFRLGMRGVHDTHMFYLWMTLVLQMGGEVMKEGRFEFRDPSLKKAYDFVRDLQESPWSREDNRKFKNTAGDLRWRYGMQMVPSYFLNPLMKLHHYRIIPWPTSGRKVILDERRHYLVVCKSTPEKEKASWEFLKWITRPDAEHPDGAWTFHLSARKDLIERKDVQAKVRAWAEGFEVMHETKGWNLHHGDQVIGRFGAMDRMEQIITRLFRGELSFEEAMREAERQCNAVLRRDWKNPSPYALYFGTGGSDPNLDPTLAPFFEKYPDIIRGFPWHPGTKRVFEEFRTSLPEEHRTISFLMKTYGETPFGLLAFDRRLEASRSDREKESLSEQMQKEKGDSPLGLLAFHRQLEHEFKRSPETFFDRCRQAVESQESEGKRAVALLARADAFLEKRAFQMAALDYLRFWGSYPLKTEKMRLREKILLVLKNAGLFLEADCIATSNRPDFVCRLLADSVHTSSGPTARRPPEASRPQDTPFVDTPQTALGERIAHEARVVSVSAFLGVESLKSIDDLLEIVESAVRKEHGDAESWAESAVCLRGLADLAIRLKCNGETRRSLLGDYEFRTAEEMKWGNRVTDAALELAFRAADQDPSLEPLVFDALDTKVEVGNRMGDTETVSESFRKTLERFPQARESADYHIRWALHLAETAGDLEGALSVLETVRKRYPETTHSEKAEFLEGIWLYEAERYAEAIPLLNRMAESKTPYSVTCELVAALARYASGDHEEGERLVQRFIRNNPDDPLGKRARVWLIGNRIADLRFGKARRLIRKIVENIPARNQALTAVYRGLGISGPQSSSP